MRVHDELHLVEGGHILVGQHLGRHIHIALRNLGDLALWDITCQFCRTWCLQFCPLCCTICRDNEDILS